MGGFFNGWRRKLGCVTLVMACVFMAEWVRSESRIDVVLFPAAWRKPGTENVMVSLAIVSTKRTIVLVTTAYGFTASPSPPVKWSSQEMSVYDSSKTSCFNTPLQWHWRFAGFGYAIARTGGSGFTFIPFWSIVLPLTFFSAYLLLSKPRVVKPKITSEPRL